MNLLENTHTKRTTKCDPFYINRIITEFKIKITIPNLKGELIIIICGRKTRKIRKKRKSTDLQKNTNHKKQEVTKTKENLKQIKFKEI